MILFPLSQKEITFEFFHFHFYSHSYSFLFSLLSPPGLHPVDNVVRGILENREEERKLYKIEVEKINEKSIERNKILNEKDNSKEENNNGSFNNHINEINKQKSADENDKKNGNQNNGNSLSTVAIGVVVKGTLNVLDEKNYRKACLSALLNVPSE